MDTSIEPIDAAVAAQLRMEMARLNITQSHIAKTTGISLRAISRYVNGVRSLKISDLAKVCEAIGVSATDILDAAEQSLE